MFKNSRYWRVTGRHGRMRIANLHYDIIPMWYISVLYIQNWVFASNDNGCVNSSSKNCDYECKYVFIYTQLCLCMLTITEVYLCIFHYVPDTEQLCSRHITSNADALIYTCLSDNVILTCFHDTRLLWRTLKGVRLFGRSDFSYWGNPVFPFLRHNY